MMLGEVMDAIRARLAVEKAAVVAEPADEGRAVARPSRSDRDVFVAHADEVAGGTMLCGVTDEANHRIAGLRSA